MDDSMRSSALAAARQLLIGYKETHLQWRDDRTPIDDIVAWLSLQTTTFHPDDRPQGTYGFVEPDEDLIWLCRGLPEPLRRFTLAHELGHVLLHCHTEHTRNILIEHGVLGAPTQEAVPDISADDHCQRPDVQEEITDLLDEVEELLGVGQSYNPRSQRELAANIFAAELLMPLERVRTLYLEAHMPADALASRFGVSGAAMLNRLAGLLNAPTAPEQAHQEKKAPPAQARKQYDEFQQVAIETATPALIVAGPGSGKTSTLIGRTEYLVNTLNVPSENILALTFSRKAAQEMVERLRQMLPGGASFPTISTFHAFCVNLLRTYGQLVGLRPDFTLVDDAEGYFLLRQLARSMRLHHYRDLWSPARHFPSMLQGISRAKDELVTPEQYEQLARRMLEEARDDETRQEAEKALEVAAVYALYEASLRERGDSDFGGLLLLTVKLFQVYPEIRYEQQQRYQHILVDEFQDMNRASGVLLRELASDARRVWVVGDANQAIYGFRGASPANIANFQADYPGANVLPLSRNYRSLPDIVRLAESFRSSQLEFGAEIGKNEPVRLTLGETYVTLASARDDASELAGLVSDLRSRLNQGYSHRDIVVLCRTRAQMRKVSRALAQAGLSVIERGGMLEQEHIKALLSFVLLLADPSGMGILRVARQQEHSFSQEDIETLLQAAHDKKQSVGLMILHNEVPPPLSVQGRHSLRRLSEIFQGVQFSTTTWEVLARYLFSETSLVRDLLLSDSKANRQALADYVHLLRLARRYDEQQQKLRWLREQEAIERGENPEPPPTIQHQLRGFLDYLRIMLTLRQEGGSRQQGNEGDTEEEAAVIRVMTIHASKGLEFPVVYLPGLSHRRFPLPRRASPISAPAGMLSPESEGEAAHESGEACLFYVGVTRARDQLILSYSQKYGVQKAKASPFLEALQAGLPQERITRLDWEAPGESEEADEALNASQPGEDFIAAMQPPTLSASALETYQQCPRRYLYSTIYHFEQEEEAAQLFLRAMQETLEELRQRATNGEKRVPTREEVAELYTHHWRSLQGHAVPFAPMYEQQGQESLEMLRRKLAEGAETNWELRSRLGVDVAGRTVQIAIDRVEAPADQQKPVRFVRTRFGKRKEKPEARTRELLYAHAYRQHYPGQRVELHEHNLTTGEMTPITLSTRKEQSLYNAVEEALQGLEERRYPPRPDPFYCPTCPFFLICPA